MGTIKERNGMDITEAEHIKKRWQEHIERKWSHFHCVRLFVTPWTVAHQAPLAMGVSRQEYWNGLPCPCPGGFPDQGIKPASPALTGGFFTTTITSADHQFLLISQRSASMQFPSIISPLNKHILRFYYVIGTGDGGGLVAKSCPTLATAWTVACQAPLSMGLPRQ